METPLAAFFCLVPEPTQFGWSRLWDLGLPEPEPPKKVVAPQHWIRNSVVDPEPDPYWIRIGSVFRSFLVPYTDPYSEYGSGSTRANKG